MVLEQQLGVLLNAKLDEFEQGLSGEASAEVQYDNTRFRSEADSVMQQLLALTKYIADHEQYALDSLPPCKSTHDSLQHCQQSWCYAIYKAHVSTVNSQGLLPSCTLSGQC